MLTGGYSRLVWTDGMIKQNCQSKRGEQVMKRFWKRTAMGLLSLALLLCAACAAQKQEQEQEMDIAGADWRTYGDHHESGGADERACLRI